MKGKIVEYSLINLCLALLLCGGVSCQPDLPMTSVITVHGDGAKSAVNPDLYGLTLEEINHGIDGGLYAELIQNRSFEDGMPPLNCPYDARTNTLYTPNGYGIPFMRSDSLPGWHALNPAATQLYPDTRELINERNRRSLLVAVSATSASGRGGLVAEGYRGIPLQAGKRYVCSFFAKGSSVLPKPLRVALEDSTCQSPASDVYRLEPIPEWRRYQHVFTATQTLSNAVLTLTTDTTNLFWVDMISLLPEDTWHGRPNGVRADLAALIDSLAPRFIRFPGGSFVEGYTAGTFPTWRETIGDVANRRSFWSIWSYGTTNGMGYHEYLQLCEDLGAEPVYVINSGVTSQSRRPRYEDITAMKKLVEEALDAIAYANAPVDSALGALRAELGHVAPFGLKYVEIGSENWGPEYNRRFVLFREAIKKRYPEVTVISSAPVGDRPNRLEWVDGHLYASERFMASSGQRFGSERYSRRQAPAFVGELGVTDEGLAGTLRAAVAEACFLVGAENNPERVRRLAYAPVLGNRGFEQRRMPLISFFRDSVWLSPSYQVWKLFASHRGDQLLPSEVETYERSGALAGRAGVYLFDNSFEFDDVRVDGQPVERMEVKQGKWMLPEPGRLRPEANRWNQVLLGDSMAYEKSYSLRLRRTKGHGNVQLRLNDNGCAGDKAEYVCLTLGADGAECYRQSGSVKESLAATDLTLENNRWYAVRLTCSTEGIACYVDDRLLCEARWPSIPALSSVATVDTARHELLLKVVNTTRHEERAQLLFEGLRVASEGEAILLTGDPDAAVQSAIAPQRKPVHFPLGAQPFYVFPPSSVTLLRLPLER